MTTAALSMKGKVCLLTGSSQGIGKATAVGLARLGATLILPVRDLARGEAVLAEIRALGEKTDVTLMQADLSSQASIRKLAEEFLQRHERLDVLINNAGGINMKRQLSPDGLELTFATNHLGYFLLTNLLLDRLKRSAPARIINVASNSHLRGRIDFDDLQGEKNYEGWRAYGQSKLANVLFTYELSRRLAGTGTTANCLHPGVVATGFGHNQGYLGVLVKLGAPFLMSPEKGARTTLYLATSPEVEGITGKYFVRCKQVRSSPASYDEEAARRLWQISAQLTNLPV